MNPDEPEDLASSCAACGADVDPRERVYGFGADAVLCFSCAASRGGSYDAAHDRWTRPPDVSDLVEPER
jgi:hypothetical protein